MARLNVSSCHFSCRLRSDSCLFEGNYWRDINENVIVAWLKCIMNFNICHFFVSFLHALCAIVDTYRRSVRTIRGIQTSSEPPLNLAKADRELVRQFGPNFCVYEDACLEHVRMAATKNAPDWHEIIR